MGRTFVVVLLTSVLAVMLFAFSYVLTTSWVHGNIRMPVASDRRIRHG